MTNSMRVLLVTCALTVGTVFLAAAAGAQQSATSSAQSTTVQTALANDVGTLSDKFVGLARVMAGKYDWRPGTGVRSVAEVFNLIVNENKMLTGLITGAASQGRGMGGRGNQITDPAEMQEALRSSYASLKEAVSSMSSNDLNASVKMFGRDTTKQSAVMGLLLDQHEHLGQSIAYARTNSVVPPWSK